MPTPAAASSFGPLLRRWREARAMSQQRLAELAEVSARHVSFLETGRAAPSREMVLLLGSALDLPLRERNVLLGAGGYAPVYRESPLEGPEMAAVRRALDHLLAHQEPFPAIVVDRAWNIVRVNDGGRRVFARFVDVARAGPDALRNAVDTLFDPRGLRSAVVNWDEIAGEVLARLHREAVAETEGSAVRALLERVLAMPDVPERLRRARGEAAPLVFVPVHLRRGETEARFFTTVTTLGAPTDVTAQELRIESYFAADDATDRWVRALAASG